MCMCALVCICVCMCALVCICVYLRQVEPEEDIGWSVTEVIDGSELSCGCQEPNPGLLQAQHVFLTTELSL